MQFDRTIYFDAVRGPLFAGRMSRQQVEGQNAILNLWEALPLSRDLRHLAYPLATSFHETDRAMWPIEEYGKGKGKAYGKPNKAGKVYYGRGFVQLTWEENYKRATKELGLEGDDDLVKHPERALELSISAEIMFRGMWEGWFRRGHTLPKYFNETTDNGYGAREIINGDKSIVPSWSSGVPMGDIIEGYHRKFMAALEAATVKELTS
jgi:hypothetical protein